jgi:hypothetical protein
VRVPAAEQLILAAEQLGGGAERAVRQVWLASDPQVWAGGLGRPAGEFVLWAGELVLVAGELRAVQPGQQLRVPADPVGGQQAAATSPSRPASATAAGGPRRFATAPAASRPAT